ncbi:hypothetical protein BD779DRAFT_1471894 [Infundibulicybe gibba]|nr:hypothetical protein BD779DRAFT_1471894 [Infundibulicybe gibba]
MFLSSHHHVSRAHLITSKLFCARTASTSLFSNSQSAAFIAAAGSAKSIPKLHGLPEVIVTGRANSGKSTLFNAVLGRKALLHTSKKAGRTRELNFFRVGPEPGKLILVDAPGYGARGRPEWGAMFDRYIKHEGTPARLHSFQWQTPLNSFDTQMLTHLSKMLLSDRGTQPFTLQSIITKADCIPADQIPTVISRMRRQIWEAAPLCLPPIVTSTQMSPPFGIEEVRKNILDACGLP